MGTVDGCGYDSQLKYTICEAYRPYHSILSILSSFSPPTTDLLYLRVAEVPNAPINGMPHLPHLGPGDGGMVGDLSYGFCTLPHIWGIIIGSFPHPHPIPMSDRSKKANKHRFFIFLVSAVLANAPPCPTHGARLQRHFPYVCPIHAPGGVGGAYY